MKFLAGFVEGFLAPVEGLAWLRREAGLWRYTLVPIAINIVVTLALLYALFREVGVAHDMLSAKVAVVWGGKVIAFLFDVILVALALGIGAGTALLLSALLCSYAYGYLAIRVERKLGTPKEVFQGVSLVGETLDTVASVGELGVVSLGVMALPFLPVIGAPLAPFVAWYLDTFIFGTKYFEYGLAARGFRRADIRAFARRNRAHTLGLGTAVFLLTLVPVLGGITLPAAVIGATALAHRLLAREVSTELPRKARIGSAT